MIVLYGSKMLSVADDVIVVKHDDENGAPLSPEEEAEIKDRVRRTLTELKGLRGLDGPRHKPA